MSATGARGTYNAKGAGSRQSMRSPVKDQIRIKDHTRDFVVDAPGPRERPVAEKETDPHRLGQRQKQIDYGKNTLGYQIYTKQKPRRLRTKEDPQTPDIYQICSKRSFDGQVRKWRRLLHEHDPKSSEGDHAVLNSMVLVDVKRPACSPTRSGTKRSAEDVDVSPQGKMRSIDGTGNQRRPVNAPQQEEGLMSIKSRRTTMSTDSWTEITKEEQADAAKSIYDDWDDDVVL